MIVNSQVIYYQQFHIWSSLIPCCPCIPKDMKKIRKRKSDIENEHKSVFAELESVA